MKNIGMRFAFFILVFHCYTISAQIHPEQLIGTWGLDYNKSMSSISEQSQKDYRLMPEVIKGEFERSYKERKLIFNANGSFIQQDADTKQMSGTWILDNNQNLSIRNSQGQTIMFKIELLTGAIMVLQLQKKENEKIILSQWYLNKN